MRLEHSFDVPVPVERAWQVLLDIERVAPCMPGATLTSHDGDAFAGTVKVKLGPVNLTFKGSGRFVEIDEAAHHVRITASGADSRGGGSAAAKVSASLRGIEAGSRVEVVSDLDITGKAAQFGRGLIGDVSARLVGQFADCLAKKLVEEEPSSTVEAAPAADTGREASVDATLASAAGGAAAEATAPAGGPVRLTAPAAETTPPASAESAAPTPAPAAASASTGSSEAASAPAAVSTAGAAPARGTAQSAEAEPIDLLAVTGISAAVRRAVPYVVTAAASFAAVLGIIWWIKRR